MCWGLAIVLAGQLGQAIADPIPSAGLVSYWAADGNANDSWDGNHGTLLEDGAWYDEGKTGQAFHFDGHDVNDYVQIGDRANLKMHDAVTIAAWVKCGVSDITNDFGTIVSKEGEYVLAIHDGAQIWYGFANTSPGWVWVDTGLTVPVTPPAWTHLAITYEWDSETDDASIKLYKDGATDPVYEGSAIGPIGDVSGLNDFRIGNRQVEPANHTFPGGIDQVAIYNRALSGAEVEQLANGDGVGVIPEPFSMAFMGSAFVGVVGWRLRRRRRARRK